MINYDLQTDVEINGKKYPINKNGDYRLILDIITVMNDEELSDRQKAEVSLNLFYNFHVPDDIPSAIDEMLKFINMGEKADENNEQPVMDWEQDFNLYIPPLNKALGIEVRAVPLHWWSFLSGYMEIDGNSNFSNIIQIRKKLQKGKKLDESEKEFYRENRKIVDLKKKLSKTDKEWLMGGD